ncbi:ABC transporter substrate-binding protein [Paenibacillus periandrae]|uniref:ABC transporter substrate-binding protein n=1 Tax=Paenibacillus periandrae TaxID=1761741 RepID=UPI001F09CC65|nr:extracellular solute-binding protein [Paenibacillus periandrae]
MFSQKRVLSLIVILSTGQLAGCSPFQTDLVTQENSIVKQPVTIKLNSWNNLNTDGFDTVIREFERTHPNIKVEFISPGDNKAIESMRKVILSAASGQDMDVIMVPPYPDYVKQVALNMFEPLDKYMENEGLHFEDQYIGDTRVKDGRYYGLPGKMNIFFIIINENHLKETGLPIPKDWTWDDYVEYAKRLTKTNGSMTRYGTFFNSLLPNLDLEKFLEIRLQGEKEKFATPYADILNKKLDYRSQYFKQLASMLVVGSYMIAEVGGSEGVPLTFKTVFAPFPKFKSEEPIRTPNFSDIFAIYSRSKHKQEAYTFIRWYTTEGIVLQGRFLPSWRKINIDQIVDTIISKTRTPENIDKESLLYVLKNSELIHSNQLKSNSSMASEIMQEEFDAMMLDNQDVRTTIDNIDKKLHKILNK